MKIQPPNNFTYHWGLHPRIYVAPYTHEPPIIDGDIHKPEWEKVPWSFDFDDIRGADAPSSDDHPPSPQCQTKFKMMWDKEYLYIAAMIRSNMEVRATYQERNSPIFHEDSDFEVFVDPAGSCHHYKELEMNPFNTVWNLMLDRPYMDGGQEHSGRIAQPGDDLYYDVLDQNTDVRILKGGLNIPETKMASQANEWGVEIALSHQDTLQFTNINTKTNMNMNKPQEGDEWRINFSRVERKGSINWTWQKQRMWDAERGSYLGKVDMHQPDAWGYVRFGPPMTSDDDNDAFGEVALDDIVTNGAGDPFWPLRLAAMNVYYAQQRYHDLHGIFTSDLESLDEFVDSSTLEPFHNDNENGNSIRLNVRQYSQSDPYPPPPPNGNSTRSNSFTVCVQMMDRSTGRIRVVEVDNERLMIVKEIPIPELRGILSLDF